MIRIICGTCGTSQGYKTGADGDLTLPAAEERRLVARGVAEYVTRPVIGGGVDGPVEGGDSGENEYEAETHTGLVNAADALDIVDGHFTRESLMGMNRSNMMKLAGDLGVDVSQCRNKGDIADLLVEVEVEAPVEPGGEAPPELGAEAPVV